MFSFLVNKIGLLLPLYILDLTYIHYQALNIIPFFAGSHFLFSVEILGKHEHLNKGGSM